MTSVKNGSDLLARRISSVHHKPLFYTFPAFASNVDSVTGLRWALGASTSDRFAQSDDMVIQWLASQTNGYGPWVGKLGGHISFRHSRAAAKAPLAMPDQSLKLARQLDRYYLHESCSLLLLAIY